MNTTLRTETSACHHIPHPDLWIKLHIILQIGWHHIPSSSTTCIIPCTCLYYLSFIRCLENSISVLLNCLIGQPLAPIKVNSKSTKGQLYNKGLFDSIPLIQAVIYPTIRCGWRQSLDYIYQICTLYRTYIHALDHQIFYYKYVIFIIDNMHHHIYFCALFFLNWMPFPKCL